MKPKILAVLGSYREGHTIDRVAAEILAAAAEQGATTEIIQLRGEPIEFCTNCRQCTQSPGPSPGPCPQRDAMASIIERIEAADALVFGAPVNFWTVNALFKRFQERLVGYAYWPWGTPGPKLRRPGKNKSAVLLIATAMPALMARFTTSAMSQLNKTAATVGAKRIGQLYIGQAALDETQNLSRQVQKKARRLGVKLLR